ncbi:hypothetical protein MTO96_047547 [Rhipicephalus appendiculatus]
MPHRDSDSDTASSSRRKRKKRTHARSGSSSSDNSSDRYRRKRRSVVRVPGIDDLALGLQGHAGGPELQSIDHGGLAAAQAPGDAHGQAVTHRGEAGEHQRQFPQRECGNQGDPLPSRTGNETDKLKQKIQQVIKAAATANAELRERGLLPSGSNKEGAAGSGASTPPSSFVSRREHGKKDSAASTSKVVDNHAAAIFGSFETLVSAAKEVVPLSNWREKPELLIHPKLKEATEVKLERWRKKLAAERRKRVNGTTTSGLLHNDT